MYDNQRLEKQPLVLSDTKWVGGMQQLLNCSGTNVNIGQGISHKVGNCHDWGVHL